MICLPPDLEPLFLLRTYCCGDLEVGARILMDNCDDMCQRREWDSADGIALQAETIGKERGDWHGRTIVLIGLAEACRKVNELNMAHRYGEQALYACPQGAVDESRMTEAVAAYSLGIIKHLRGTWQEAGECYRYGHSRFKQVKEDCLRVNHREQARYCDHAAQLITELWRHSSKELFEAHGGRYPILTGFCIGSDGAIEYRIIELETADFPSEWQASIDGEQYGLRSLPDKDLNRLILDSAETYLATMAPKTAHPYLETQDGDYILVHYTEELDNDPDRSSLGNFVYLGKGKIGYVPCAPFDRPKDANVDWWPGDYLKFERRPDGSIFFCQVEPSPARIIGGTGYGYPIAILRLRELGA